MDGRLLVALVSLAEANGVNQERLSLYKNQYDELAFVFDSTINLVQHNTTKDQDKTDYAAMVTAWQKMNTTAADVFNFSLSQNKEEQEKVSTALHSEIFSSGKILEEKVGLLVDRDTQQEEASSSKSEI